MKKFILNSYKCINYLLIFVSFFILISSCQTEKAEDSFRFVFMTDIHVQPDLKGDEGFKQAIAKVNQLKPDFVITGGDLVFDALRQSHERATQLYDMYIDVCTEFNMPVYNTLGNHEVFGLYEKSGVSPEHKEYGKKMYKRRTGYENTYYSFDHKGWHFMILDDIGFTEDRQYIAEIDSVQLEWIKDDLKQISRKTPIVISVHIPFVSIGEQMRSGGTAALSPAIALSNSHKILALFESYNLKLVLQGHLHIVEDIIYQDIHYITAGAVSGKWWKGPLARFSEGFAVIDVKENDFSWKYETFGWKTVYEEQ
jgi:3',5'-cyclic-AMP phosphodiesterase